MALFEERTAAFILRVWCEEGDAIGRTAPEWRGSIEHVDSGRRICFRDTDAIVVFICPYIDALLDAGEASH